MALLVKAAVPVVLAGTGAALLLTAPGAKATTGAWIDDPLAQTTLAPGSVTVLAHATAPDSLSSMDLLVDGQKVATDSSLERNDSLRLASFTWTAVAGDHVLTVKAGKVTSQAVPVLVGSPTAVPPPPTATPTTRPTAVPTTTPSATPTTTPSATPSPTPVRTSAAPTVAPTTAPPTKSPTPKPVVAPTITSTGVSPRTLNHTSPQCDTSNPTAALTVRTSGPTTKVTVTFTSADGSPVVVTLTGSGTWSGQVTAKQLDPYTEDLSSRSVTWTVTVRAYNGTAVRSQSAGTLTLDHGSCKP